MVYGYLNSNIILHVIQDLPKIITAPLAVQYSTCLFLALYIVVGTLTLLFSSGMSPKENWHSYYVKNVKE